MANRKSKKPSTSATEKDIAPVPATAIPPEDPDSATPETTAATLQDQSEQKLIELTNAAEALRDAIAAMQTQNAKDAEFRETIATLKSAARAVTTGAATAARSPQSDLRPFPVDEGCNCDDNPCQCVSPGCCCFDIVMSSVRVLAMQPLELADSNLLNPWGELEVKMFAYLENGIGTMIPSLFSTISLKKLIQWPGLKVRVNRTIGTVCLPKGKPKTITIGVDAIEEDSGLAERLTGGRDEEGSNSSTMVLDCCCNAIPTTVFDVAFTSGGQGGGAIEVEFVAMKRC